MGSVLPVGLRIINSHKGLDRPIISLQVKNFLWKNSVCKVMTIIPSVTDSTYQSCLAFVGPTVCKEFLDTILF